MNIEGIEMIPIRHSSLNYIKDIPLFVKTQGGRFIRFEERHFHEDDLQRDTSDRPKVFIRHSDKLISLEEMRRGFSDKVKASLDSGDLRSLKQTLSTIIEETLEEPRSGLLSVSADAIDAILERYEDRPKAFAKLAMMSEQDYTTAIHSINVMALSLGYCGETGMRLEEMREMALGAMLHDLGKGRISKEILNATRKLTDQEFGVMKMHTLYGYSLLAEEDFSHTVQMIALEHHEKLDGSGYPHGKTDITEGARIVGIIDCFEALTSNERPYRSAMSALKAMELIRDDLMHGKFDMRAFRGFITSLAG